VTDGGGFEATFEWFFGRVYDKIEDRSGRVAAFFVTLLLTLGSLGLIAFVAWFAFS